MNVKLANACLGLWGLGMIGMLVCRVALEHGPGTLTFDACARVWVVGGLTYGFVAVLALVDGARDRGASG